MKLRSFISQKFLKLLSKVNTGKAEIV